MKPFDTLTESGRTRRLRKVAEVALAHYDLDVAKLSVLSTSFNTIFRVDATDGQKYVLRVNIPNFRTPIDIRSEMTWLDALSRETDIPITTPLHTKNGELFVTIAVNGVPEPRHCAMFHWINGRTLKNPTSNTIAKVGTVMARLQNHADTFQPAQPFSTTNYRTTFQFGTPAPIYDSAPDPIYTEHRRQIVQAAAQRVDVYLEKLYQDPTGLRFLHADLHLWNVKLHNGKIRVFDFDDSMYCYPVQDIGIALFYFERKPDSSAIRAAFKKGYTAVRPWPETFPGEIDTVIAHRTLDLLSLIVRDFPLKSIDGFLKNSLPRLEKWLAQP